MGHLCEVEPDEPQEVEEEVESDAEEHTEAEEAEAPPETTVDDDDIDSFFG